MEKSLKAHIDLYPLRQLLVQYIIWTEAGKDLVGYCLITGSVKTKSSELFSVIPGEENIIGQKNQDGWIKSLNKPGHKHFQTQHKEAAIWHIYIKPEFRRQGYATACILALKDTYDTIYAQTIVPDFKELLKANRFEHEDGKIPQYRWTKKIDES